MHYFMKRAAAFILTVAMAVSMAVSAFAVEAADGTTTSSAASETVAVETESSAAAEATTEETDTADAAQPEKKTVALSDKISTTAVVTESGLRIREKASTESSILTVMDEGAIVTVLSAENADGWMKISYKDASGKSWEGYVNCEYLEMNAIGAGTVSTRSLIVRESADNAAAMVGIVQEGTEVTIYAVESGWYQVECGGYSGYVDSSCIEAAVSSTCVGYGTVTADYLNLRASADLEGSKLTTIPGGVTFQITSEEQDGWYAAIFNGMSGYVSADYIAVSDSIDSGYIQVTADSLTLRAGAGTQYAQLAIVSCGQLLTVEGTVGDWYMVTYQGFTGYVNGAYVSATTSEGYQAYPDRAKITASSLALRDGASTGANRLTSLDEGTVVAVSDLVDGWYKVTYDGTVGYIDASYTVATEESVTTVTHSSSSSSRSSSSGSKKSSSSGSKSSSSSSGSSSSSSSSSGSTSPSKSGSAVLAYAQNFVGNPYKWGGTSLTNGCDCSGFVMSVYAHFGVSLPHSSASMRSVGRGVSVSDMQVGDIVCYSGHVGIYAGNGQLLSALGRKYGITYNSVHYKTILAVRRIF
jgi:uncharacterized protein YgiM (DUF1202 family)